MPWSTDDVERFKKGLSDEGKKKWVATANSVLSECMKNGGTEKECAGKAVRIASGTTNNEGYHIYKKIRQDPAYTVKEKKYQGRNHLIVPVVMMVEGVHNGSHGPLFHSIEDLGKFPESWNGIPVVIDHPEIDGVNVSANNPDILESRKVGRIYNAYIKDIKKLAAEIWLDEEKLQKLSQTVLDQVRQGIPLEVSLGMFTEEEFVTGEWNGEHYDAIAKNHRPDHLALLPGSVGACSLADGCGVRANSDPSVDDAVVAEIIFNNTLEKEDKKMANAISCTPCVKQKVDDLIANSQGKYTEGDREMLETLNEDLIDRIAQPVEKTVEVIKEVEKIIEVNVLSEADKTDLAVYRKQLKDKRDAIIKTIQDNLGKETWTDEVLGSMQDEILEKVVGLVKKNEVVDYSLNGGNGVQTNQNKVEPLPPTGIKFKK